jgi:hypothetical protein
LVGCRRPSAGSRHLRFSLLLDSLSETGNFWPTLRTEVAKVTSIFTFSKLGEANHYDLRTDPGINTSRRSRPMVPVSRFALSTKAVAFTLCRHWAGLRGNSRRADTTLNSLLMEIGWHISCGLVRVLAHTTTVGFTSCLLAGASPGNCDPILLRH